MGLVPEDVRVLIYDRGLLLTNRFLETIKVLA